METTDKIVLVSKEGEKQIVDSRILDMSEYLKEKRDNHDIHDNTVVLDNIGENTLSRIIAFCNYHIDNPLAEIERPLKSSNMRDIVSEWDANFINISVEDLMDLIVAANFLLIQPLLEVACAKVASLIKGKSPEEIRTTFKIVSDFTPEEEAKIREENKWAIEE
ncbi:uncharacterized protein [Blastocystis hominis]|uniref:SKP1-like protein n=1 Tax=Blastocystis hominis TaxID=12968 RepID=D8M6F6_BLAHO|nr:uncharacterized protein [Blastocystis hominis]CBK23709.2 unnamed protein product [Blastocystis hominis]|eukprot:XP_012897757.1 uncharacterized protein [Blastocystis hominis]